MSRIFSRNSGNEPQTHHFSLVSATLVLLPLILGGTIYVLWRPASLLMFDWFQRIGLHDPIAVLRLWAEPLQVFLPDWALYCLPNGLWAFSATAFFATVWARQPDNAVYWAGLIVLIGIGSEIGQLVGAVPGTFQYGDLLAYLLGGAGGIVISRRVFGECEEECASESGTLTSGPGSVPEPCGWKS